MTRIFISAGEPSGDAHAGALAAELRKLKPALDFRALGGERLAEAGATLVHHYRDIAVVGLVEVLKHYPQLKRVFDDLVADFDSHRPDLLVLVDFPDFNLRLAEKAAARGIPIVYYISPQVWAWRKGRIKQLKRLVKKMLVILPFEREIYEQAGVPVAFTGHPLADHYAPPDAARDAGVVQEFRARHALSQDAPLIGLLPGSRRGEVARLLPPLLGAAKILAAEFPAAHFLIPAPETLADENFAVAAGIPQVKIIRNDYPELLRSLDAVAVASGTATLECGWHGIPGGMVYRIAPVTYLIAKRLVKVPHVALVNLVADLPQGGRVYPELIQGDCTPEKIAALLRPLLGDPVERTRQRAALAIVREKLGGPGASRRAAEEIAKLF